MAHQQQFNYIQKLKSKHPTYFINKKVLEVGSLNINGTIRPLFTNCDYLGIDVGSGKDVDLVCEGQNLDHPNETYDTVCSCECFEHNPYWVETFNNMYRMTKLGGLVFMSCATTGRQEHGTTRTSPQDSPLTTGKGWDYYKNLTTEDFILNFNLGKMFSYYEFEIGGPIPDLYFYGIKQ
jgi:SAM-dependent methyltransferase